ncbi:hypothetical protein [Demequina sp. NBRC 110053]|uniref:hypothetical protein n=1 Tax=Demequina sp. NBRC 110053 TaxID=1570342 RepID=UPI0009FC1D5C|nr:hypothetical protein [Demequina sp. NBRC 110053]
MTKYETATDVLIEADESGRDVARVFDEAKWQLALEHYGIPVKDEDGEEIGIVAFVRACRARGVMPGDVMQRAFGDAR